MFNFKDALRSTVQGEQSALDRHSPWFRDRAGRLYKLHLSDSEDQRLQLITFSYFDERIAYAYLLKTSTGLQVADMKVKKRFRGRGIGKQLLRSVLQFARRDGYEFIFGYLSHADCCRACWLPDMYKAHRFDVQPVEHPLWAAQVYQSLHQLPTI
jgi:GNAT superfamily N-acetyltransferase